MNDHVEQQAARAASLWDDMANVFAFQGHPGASGAELTAFHVPSDVPDGVRFEPSVVYGTAGAGGRELDLVLYARVDTSERRPAVVFVHGGAWAAMHPNMHLRQAHALAAEGYVTASISYRFSDEAPWPAALEDTKCAIRWVRDHAAELGADPDRIAVAGGSAGGHLALLAALTPGRWEGTGGCDGVSSAVQAAVAWYPVVNLSGPEDGGAAAIGPLVDAFLGEPTDERRREASPMTHAHGDGPPVLVLTGEADPLVPVDQVRGFAEKVRAAGGPVELHVEPGGVHGYEVLPDAWPADYERMRRFLAVTLGE